MTSKTKIEGPLPAVAFEVHDRDQLEFRFRFDLTSEPRTYVVDTYFFIPRSIGINPGNFSREDFYDNVTALIRLDATLERLAQLSDVGSEANPLRELQDALRAYRDGAFPVDSEWLPAHSKLFAYLFDGEIRRRAKAFIKAVRRSGGGAELVDLEVELTSFLAEARESMVAYRRLQRALNPYVIRLHQPLHAALQRAEEYMSVALEERLASISIALTSEGRLFDGSGIVPRMRHAVRELAEYEALERKRRGYLSLTTQDEHRREYVVYRRSILKKTVHQALYLNVRGLKRDRYMKNGVASVAAALAAVWAWATQVPSAVGLSNDTKLFMFATAVLGYVAKDRIKAATSDWLSVRLNRFDHTWRIAGESLATFGLARMDAELKERMSYVPIESVDRRVFQARMEGRTLRDLYSGSTREEVIHYQKVMAVDGVEAIHESETQSVLDTLRLNVSEFLTRLDEPHQQVEMYSATDKTFAAVTLPRVYHLNVVIKLSREDESGRVERFHRFRVVLNKNGIVRVTKAKRLTVSDEAQDPM